MVDISISATDFGFLLLPAIIRLHMPRVHRWSIRKFETQGRQLEVIKGHRFIKNTKHLFNFAEKNMNDMYQISRYVDKVTRYRPHEKLSPI